MCNRQKTDPSVDREGQVPLGEWEACNHINTKKNDDDNDSERMMIDMMIMRMILLQVVEI